MTKISKPSKPLQELANAFKADVIDLLKKHFPGDSAEDFSNDESKYSKCLAFVETRKDLISIVGCDQHPGPSARALTSLLIPEKRQIFDPYYRETIRSWDEDLFLHVDFRFLNASLSLKMLKYAGELFLRLCQLKTELKKIGEFDDDPLWIDICLSLLSVLPPEENISQLIFDQFSLNDDAAVRGEITSGYNPFWKLMGNDEVPDKWKCLADQKMRAIITSELEGKSVPRAEWENAERCYLKLLCYGMTKSYSPELLAEQLPFILKLPRVKQGQTDFFFWETVNISNRLKGDQYVSVKYDAVHYAVMGNSIDPWRVRSEEDVEAAHEWIELFGREDRDLQTKLVELIMAFREEQKTEKKEGTPEAWVY